VRGRGGPRERRGRRSGIADSHVAQVDIPVRPVVADNDVRQAGVAMDERFAGDICLEWAIFRADRMKGAQRGGEHFDDRGRRPGFRQGGQVGTRHGRHEQCVCVFHAVKRDNLRNRQPAGQPAQPGAFARQPIAYFEKPPHIAGLDFKYRAVVAAAGPINARVGHIQAGGGPAYICRC
jgi:hypothetical protein